MFTQVRSASRRVSPVEVEAHKHIIKVVYVVLEPQYQNALTQAANSINNLKMAGYLLVPMALGYLALYF